MEIAVSSNPAVEQWAQDVAGVGAAHAGDFLGGAGGDDAAAVFAAFRAKVDDVVGGFDDVEVVFDDQHRVSQRNQALQHVEQFVNVGEMQSRCRFVKDVDGPAGGAF